MLFGLLNSILVGRRSAVNSGNQAKYFGRKEEEEKTEEKLRFF